MAQTPARRALIQFLVAVAVLHSTAIALYYVLHLRDRPDAQQRLFAWTWLVLTAAVIFGGLQRIRRLRTRTRTGTKD